MDKNNAQKKALVLGAGGFIGSHLVKALSKKGFTIQAAGNNITTPEEFNIVNLSGSIDKNLYKKCDYPSIIFYAAGGSSVAESIKNPSLDFNKTFPNLVELLEIINHEWHDTKLIYISSAAVYGKNASKSTSIKCQLSPISPYGLHKKISEDIIQFYVKNHNINAKIIRPFSVYGNGLKKQLLWDALNKSLQGDFIYSGSGHQQRDWVHINDLIEFIISVSEKANDVENNIFNAGSGEGISIKTIITMLLHMAGYNKKPRFSSVNKSGDPDNLVSCKEEQIDYHLLYKTKIQKGLESYVHWFNENKQK